MAELAQQLETEGRQPYVIPVGGYHYNDVVMSFNMGQQRRLSGNIGGPVDESKWLRPTNVLTSRFFKLGAKFDF